MTRSEIAQARLKAASEHVEAAQHELERAMSALAALRWMDPEMTKLGVLRDRIHEAFYRLAPISHARAKACAKATIDREPEAGDEDPHKGCCAGYAIPDAVRRYAEKARLVAPERLRPARSCGCILGPAGADFDIHDTTCPLSGER